MTYRAASRSHTQFIMLFLVSVAVWAARDATHAVGADEATLEQHMNQPQLSLLYCEISVPGHGLELTLPSLSLALWSDGVAVINIDQQTSEYRAVQLDSDECKEFFRRVADEGLFGVPSRGAEFCAPGASYQVIAFSHKGSLVTHSWDGASEMDDVVAEFSRRWCYTKVLARDLIITAFPKDDASSVPLRRARSLDVGRILRGR